MDNSALDSPQLTTTGLRCKSCRAVIFDNENVFTQHENERRMTIKSRGIASTTCSHYFLDGDVILSTSSLKWLENQTQTGSPEGPINCFKCSHKLGSFNWKGAQCGCGAWQIPAIGIIKSKVDPIRREVTTNRDNEIKQLQ